MTGSVCLSVCLSDGTARASTRSGWAAGAREIAGREGAVHVLRDGQPRSVERARYERAPECMRVAGSHFLDVEVPGRFLSVLLVSLSLSDPSLEGRRGRATDSVDSVDNARVTPGVRHGSRCEMGAEQVLHR